MSHPPKKQNKAIKTAHIHKNLNNAGQTESSTIAEKNATTFPVDLSKAYQFHQNYLASKNFDEFVMSSLNRVHSIRDNIFRNATVALEREVEKGIKKMENAPLIRNLFDQVLKDAQKNLKVCTGLETDAERQYAEVADIFKENTKTIEGIHEEMQATVDANMNLQKLLDREWDVMERNLDKAEREILYSTESRDNVCTQIAEIDKISNDLCQIVQSLVKANETFATDIVEVKRKSEEDNTMEFMNELSNKASQWFAENSATINKIEQEKMQLNKEQDEINASMVNTKKEHEDLCEKLKQMTELAAKQEKLIARVKAANKNLVDDKTTAMELQQTTAKLSAELKSIKDDEAVMKSETEKKERAFLNSIRIREQISTKQQTRATLQHKLNELKNDQRDQERRISIMVEYITEIKSHLNDERNNPNKRLRISADDLTTEVDSDDRNELSTFHLPSDIEFAHTLDYMCTSRLLPHSRYAKLKSQGY